MTAGYRPDFWDAHRTGEIDFHESDLPQQSALAKGADCGVGTDGGCEAAKPSASNEPNEQGNAA